ncbi:MAG TPA: S4 domain-containing protein [Longimicrobiaceae bacterium]|nr:S4 domain-containing protein [Longimicrobiaceae bacterium]
MAEGLRIDVLLHRLCLTRSRNEAKSACDAGAVSLNGKKARAADAVLPGARLEVRWPARTLEMELLELPGKSVSRKAARELYRVLREERTPESW